MPQIAVVTDSAGDLPLQHAHQLQIEIVPLKIRFQDKEYIDGIELSVDEFWDKAAKSDTLAQTAAPSIGDFESKFQEVAEKGATEIVCITLSSDLSATYQSAVGAAKDLSNDLNIRVIDSRLVSLAQGYLAMHASHLAADGKTLDEISEAILGAIPNISVYGALDTLENLRKGGRIGAAQALVGSLLSFKPVIEVRNGVVLPESRQRTRAKALSYLLEKASALGPLRWAGVMHANANDLDNFVDELKNRTGIDSVFVTKIGPVIGAHAGPRTLGLSLVKR